MCSNYEYKIVENVFYIAAGLALVTLAISLEPHLFSYGQLSNNNGNNGNNQTTTTTTTTTIIFSNDSSPFGLTYAEWTAKWWQWAYSIPKDIHPAYDDSGRYCTLNQSGPVWFFPGSYGKDVLRQCAVPSDKAILFPILNSECSFAEFTNLKSEEELRQCAKEIQDSVVELRASIDGNNITNLEDFRIQSPLFSFTLPENNILNLPPQITQAVSDGNWVFLKPLSEGNHTLSFKGSLRNASDVETNNSSYAFAVPYGWDNNVTYHLTITAYNDEEKAIDTIRRQLE
jgi:hypothetical protein